MFNIRSVDLNLLPVSRRFTRKRAFRGRDAAPGNVPQVSAVSHAMTRLRAVFRDELFVRHSRGVTPTPTADGIYARLRDALGSVRETVTERRAFHPGTSTRKFFLTITHPLGPMILLRLIERLAAVAPGIAVTASTRSRPIDRTARFAKDVSMGLDWLDPDGDHFKSMVLFEDSLVAVAREGHPACARRNRSRCCATANSSVSAACRG